MKNITVICMPHESAYDFFTYEVLSLMKNSGINYNLVYLDLRASIDSVFDQVKEQKPDCVAISTNFGAELMVVHRLRLEQLAISRKCNFDIILAGSTVPPTPDKSILEMSSGDVYYERIDPWQSGIAA